VVDVAPPSLALACGMNLSDKCKATSPSEGHAVVQLAETLCYKPEGLSSIPDGVIGISH
jgi:hypothetical protein